MHLAGEVKRQSSSIDTPFALDGAGVRATIDRNHDGSISADEAYTTQTDADGAYTLDVPLYWFDEVKGTWVRDDNPGHLEDAQGKVIAPSSLPAIHDGSFAGAIYAVGNVTHFSTWNIDWPISTFGCVSGRVLDENGKPAEGATVTVRGVSYTGTSTPMVLGADGHFCLEAMRSEAPGEDLDGNGKAGEKTTVSIRVVAGLNAPCACIPILASVRSPT